MTEKSTIQMKKYLNKIKDLIENPTFKLMNKRYVKKNRIDDLICCIEANFPDSFKKIIKEKRYSTVNCGKYYKSLLSTLTAKKGIIFSDCYVIQYDVAITYIKSIDKNIDSDVKKLEENSGSMF